MVDRRIEEVGLRGLMFPGYNPKMLGPSNVFGTNDQGEPYAIPDRTDIAGIWASHLEWHKHVFMPAAARAGWPMKTIGDSGKPASYQWHPHDLRHCAATYMLGPRSPNADMWWEGLGLAAMDVAAALGDTIQTVLTRYVGHHAESHRRIAAAFRRE